MGDRWEEFRHVRRRPGRAWIDSSIIKLKCANKLCDTSVAYSNLIMKLNNLLNNNIWQADFSPMLVLFKEGIGHIFAPLIRGMIDDAAGIPCGHCLYLGSAVSKRQGCYYKP